MLIFNFLSWHYIKGSKTILKAWFNFISLSFHIFSVKLLFKTLFSPWRRVEAEKKAPGLSAELFFHRFSFNLIARDDPLQG